MRALVWFRGDLRCGDNAALSAATREATRGVVAVYAVCPGQWREHDWADVRVDFVLRNLAELSRELEGLNIPLRFVEADRFAQAPGALLRVARELGCEALYLNRELEVNEVRRDGLVRGAFEGVGIAVREFDDQCIVPPGEVRTKEGRWYTVYTPFRKRFGEVLGARGGVTLAPKPRKQAEMVCAADEAPPEISGFNSLKRPDLWPAGERAARKRLGRFIAERIGRYGKDRDAPAISGTSTLSPCLTSGVISARECLSAALDADARALSPKAGSKGGPATWADELVWREFSKHLIVGYPRLCMGTNFRREYDAVPWCNDERHFAAWREGRTGVPIVDAAMRQLAQTGWMHNRCRMIVATFLTKNLLIDWRWGERHFMRSLVDGDLASNNGGWQWSASTGTDAAPYFRVFNPVSQSRTHDPGGEFVRRFVPELAGVEGDAVHEPWRLPGLERSRLDYPEPIVDLAESRRRAIDVFREVRGVADR